MQSGRFETNTKICLSISSYHPEQWQPSWSMRTALTALIAFFPSPAKGAVGSLEASDAERAQMALESRLVVSLSLCLEELSFRQHCTVMLSRPRMFYPRHMHWLHLCQASMLPALLVRCRRAACRQRVPRVTSAERMEVMHRLHAFLLRQSDKPGSLVEQPTEASKHVKGSNESQEHQSGVSLTSGQEASAPAAVSVAAQQRRAEHTTLQVCMRCLDRLIMLALSVLALLIAWNVYQ
jgi:hypothetical protein